MNTMTLVLVVGAGGFAGGLFCGLLWREAYELFRGRDDPMALFRRIFSARISTLTLGLIIAILFNCAVGVGLILNGNKQEAADRRDAALSRCQKEYNRLSGEARDERLEVGAVVAEAQLRYVENDLEYQTGLLEGLESNLATVDPLLDVIRERVYTAQQYLDTLKDQKKVRLSTEYPAPDFCDDLTAYMEDPSK